MRRRSRIWSYLSLLMIAGLLAAACTSTPGTSTPSAAADADAIDPNGELTTNETEPENIDPQKESFVNEVNQTMTVFEALLGFDPKALKPIPAAAKEMPKLSADGLTYTFTLRDGLKYSDGSPVTAKDFAYGFTRLCDPNVAGEYAFSGFIIVGCEKWSTMDTKKATKAELDAAKAGLGIKVNGDKEISFTLTEKAPYFVAIAALWVGVPTRESDVTKGGDNWATGPATYVGNGPFKMVEWKHNEKLVYERNDNYRNPAKLKKWTKVMINEAAVAFAAYRNNELDTVGIGAEQLRTVDGDADLKAQVVDVGGSCTFYMGFNNTKPPFDDAKVRLAFAKAFDRKAYITDVAKIGAPADPGGFIPPGFPGYDKDDTAQKFDPAAAKTLLSQSKYAGTDTLKNVKFGYGASATAKTRVEWMQQQLQTNLPGVTIAPDPVDATTFSGSLKKLETTPQMFRLGWCADYPDQQDWHTTVFHSSATVSHTGYKNTEFDRLVRQADPDPNPESRDKTYFQASKILSQDAPVAWWYYNAVKYLKKPWVKGVQDSSMDAGELSTFATWSVGVTKRK